MTNASVMKERAAVLAAIEAAFDGVELDGGTTLHEARAMDDWEPEDVQRAARAKDPETRWQDVTDEKIREMSDTTLFLCHKGFRFYVPAFLGWVLRHLDDEDDEHSGLNDSAILTVGEHIDHAALLDQRQRQAVCLFFRHLARSSEWWKLDAERFLSSYWGQFCPEGENS